MEESKLASTPPATKEDSKRQQSSAIKQPSFNASTPVTKPPVSSAHNQLFSPPNFTNISAIKKKEEVRDVRRMLATPEGTKIYTIFLDAIASLATRHECKSDNLKIYEISLLKSRK